MDGDCAQIAEVLATYEKESGKKLNKEKTSLFFSKNTSMDIQERAKETFGAQIYPTTWEVPRFTSSDGPK